MGTLVLGGQNTYGGGTDIEQGEVQLENYSCLGADTGTLQLGTSGTLDLNGCPIVVGWLGNGNSPTGGAITDGSVLANSAYGGVTRFTVATSGLNDAFAGSIRDSHYPGNSFAAVRLVKSGTGMLTLGGYNTYTGGTEVDGGTLKLDSSSAFPHYGTLSVNYPGVFDMNDIGSTGSGFPTVIVGALDGNGTITDNHNSAQGGTTTLDVDMAGSSPCLFTGVIEDGALSGGQPQRVALRLDLEGMLTLTGPNTYTGGTEIWDGWLQVGDGQTYGSMITGAVEDDSTGGLTFDIRRPAACRCRTSTARSTPILETHMGQVSARC